MKAFMIILCSTAVLHNDVADEILWGVFKSKLKFWQITFSSQLALHVPTPNIVLVHYFHILVQYICIVKSLLLF